MGHKLEPEMITLAYSAAHMRPRAAAAFERLEQGKGENDDMIEASRHFREMGQEEAARHLRRFVLKSVLANTAFVFAAALLICCETVEAGPGCDPAECSADCLSMDYGAGYCYAPAGDGSDLDCWCIDPRPGPGACVEGDQGCKDGTIYECTGNQWQQPAGDVCHPVLDICREYLAPDLDGGIANRARCQERDCE